MQNMTQQDEGWPLGLVQTVNARNELVRNTDNAGSISFNTLLTASPSSSTDFSSDLDTQSTGSFFPDKSTTLGSLMGVSSILELSRRGAKTELFKSKSKSKNKINFSCWLFCFRSRNRNSKAESHKHNPPSLGEFLAVERRVANENSRNQSLVDELALAETNITEQNSLFLNGNIAPPHSISSNHSIGTQRETLELRHDKKGFGSLSVLFSCICGHMALANS